MIYDSYHNQCDLVLDEGLAFNMQRKKAYNQMNGLYDLCQHSAVNHVTLRDATLT